MHSFEQIRSHVGRRHDLLTNDPYLVSFDVRVADGRNQSLFLTELEDDAGRKHLRISTPVGPSDGVNIEGCLRFNWQQRTGFLAISDLDGSPYLHLCENRPYDALTAVEIDRVIDALAALGDRMERAMSGGDAL